MPLILVRLQITKYACSMNTFLQRKAKKWKSYTPSELEIGVAIQQSGLSHRFHGVPHPILGRTSLRFSVELPAKWAIPIYNGSFVPKEVHMGSTRRISRFSPIEETSSFYNNYSCSTRRHSSHSPRTSLLTSWIILPNRRITALLDSAHNTLPPTFWSTHEPVSARNAWRKVPRMIASFGG